MIDVNVSVSQWPFRRLPLDETATLAARLTSLGVEQAWAGSFEALLHRDVDGVNRRVRDECARIGEGRLLPMGAINPMLPDWQEDLRRCAQEYGMRGVRLHPNYHGYRLEDDVVGELFTAASAAGLIVQIVIRMEDDRTQHPLVSVADVDVQPLGKRLEEHPELPVVLLNALKTVRGAALDALIECPNVTFEIAMLEGVGGISQIIRQVPYERLHYGSHAPFFSPESARLKLEESDLGETIRSAITTGNARRLLGDDSAN